MTRYLTRAAFALLITTGTVGAQNQAGPGSGNALAIKQAGSSVLVSSARDFILTTLNDVQDARARDITRDAGPVSSGALRYRRLIAFAPDAR